MIAIVRGGGGVAAVGRGLWGEGAAAAKSLLFSYNCFGVHDARLRGLFVRLFL